MSFLKAAISRSLFNTVLVFTVFALLYVWWARFEPSAPLITLKTSSLYAPQKKTASLKVRTEFDPVGPSNEEMRQLLSSFGNAKSGNSFKLDTLVQAGQSIVADAYEGKPGEIVYTKFTPTIKRRPDGTRVAVVKVESFCVSFGGTKSITSDAHELDSKTILDTGSTSEEGTYRISLTASIQGNLIRLKADGKFFQTFDSASGRTGLR